MQNADFDIWMMLGFGVLGYVFRTLDCPLTPLTLALVLGDRTEDEFQQAMIGLASKLLDDYGALVRQGRELALLLTGHAPLTLRVTKEALRRVQQARHEGSDLIAQGMSRLMAITGENPKWPPVMIGASVTDITIGVLAALDMVAAHACRPQTGEGQRMETSLLEAGRRIMRVGGHCRELP